MPNTVGAMLCESDLKDLGVHTEMYVDAYVDLAMAGKVTCMKKNIDRGRQVFAFAAGTQKLYDYLDDNPACMAAPISYTNDIRTIAAIDNFISINNAVDVDLYGQVNGETAAPSRSAAPADSRTLCWVRICPRAVRALSVSAPLTQTRTVRCIPAYGLPCRTVPW